MKCLILATLHFFKPVYCIHFYRKTILSVLCLVPFFILFYFTVKNWISQEGLNFLQLRIKHLMKTNCIQQAMLLSKVCSDSVEISTDCFFRQSFITCLCTMLPDEEAFKEVHTDFKVTFYFLGIHNTLSVLFLLFLLCFMLNHAVNNY